MRTLWLICLLPYILCGCGSSSGSGSSELTSLYDGHHYFLRTSPASEGEGLVFEVCLSTDQEMVSVRADSCVPAFLTSTQEVVTFTPQRLKRGISHEDIALIEALKGAKDDYNEAKAMVGITTAGASLGALIWTGSGAIKIVKRVEPWVISQLTHRAIAKKWQHTMAVAWVILSVATGVVLTLYAGSGVYVGLDHLLGAHARKLKDYHSDLQSIGSAKLKEAATYKYHNLDRAAQQWQYIISARPDDVQRTTSVHQVVQDMGFYLKNVMPMKDIRSYCYPLRRVLPVRAKCEPLQARSLR